MMDFIVVKAKWSGMKLCFAVYTRMILGIFWADSTTSGATRPASVTSSHLSVHLTLVSGSITLLLGSRASA